jgi:hypothetical protein
MGKSVLVQVPVKTCLQVLAKGVLDIIKAQQRPVITYKQGAGRFAPNKISVPLLSK